VSGSTGMSMFGSLLAPKKFELMHELVPKAAAIAILVNSDNPNSESIVKMVKAAGDGVGRSLVVVTDSTDREIESTYATVIERRCHQALLMVCRRSRILWRVEPRRQRDDRSLPLFAL
jgi:putative tryptophan/tyrosine transport system substrate-binding protein